MKIALINVSGRLSSEGSHLISSLLKRAGHTVKSVFLSRKFPILYERKEIELLDEIIRDVDLIMIAVYSAFSIRAAQITEFVREKYPGMKIIWGGPHCISAPELSLDYADIVCFAEGDEAVVDLVDKMDACKDYTDTPNMAFNIKGNRIINNVLPPFSDLDSLPYPDYDLDNQFLLDQGLFQMTKDLLERFYVRYPFTKPTFWILTARGCPNRCSYCNNCRYIAIYGHNPMRFRRVDNFISELEYLVGDLGFFEGVGFGDDDFFVRPVSQIEDFAAKYKKKIGLPFIVGVSANTFKKEKMEILLDAGMKVIQMGVQSGSQRVLEEVFDRKVSVSKTIKSTRQIIPYNRSHGLQLILDFIIDTPYETIEDILKTFCCLIDIPQEVRVNAFVLTFFPGTPIYERALRDGFIKPFSINTFRHYRSRNIIYQKNYAMFLVLMIQLLRNKQLLQYIPKRVLTALISMPAITIASIFTKSFYSYIIKHLRPEIRG